MFLQCFPNDKVSDIINKYKEITNIYSPDIQFSFNGVKLNENLTAEESGLYHNSNIIITTLKIEDKINPFKKEYKEQKEEESEKEKESEEKEFEEKDGEEDEEESNL